MFHGEVKDRYRKGQIGRVIVLRMLRLPWPPKKPRSGRETDFTYLIFFMPSDSNESPDDHDYFIFRNRAGEQDRPIFYQSLFTISKDMETWGIRDYAVLDETRHEGLEGVLTGIKDYLSKRRESIKPIQHFLDNLATVSRSKTKGSL